MLISIYVNMPNIVTITSISGNSPFDIYVCDQTISYCYYVQQIVSGPYSFDVPSPLESANPIVLKIIDSSLCESIYPLECQTIYGKEFEDFPIFLFQDASIYLYQGE